MDFNISDKMKTILGMMREFVDKELIPLEPELLTKDAKSLIPVIKEKQAMVKKMELWAPNHPKELGGMGLDLVEHGLVSEVLGRTPIGHYVFNCQAPDAGNIEILDQFGSDEQKEKYLRPLVDGKIRSCFSMTEVDMPGSNPIMRAMTPSRATALLAARISPISLKSGEAGPLPSIPTTASRINRSGIRKRNTSTISS